ncbi:SusC/RagA family TonB-linked outer membrane protein [Parabacteroides sp. PF5-9]|uniref:SusC/RagA family TonB-linked outer membrane protein n=1 Tax=Parabacteroides sp. PF5-9 TaxID=1742404 RepID=UPI0024744918|nr:SusC/RagA family TonB-linked outer membrane protein [Parabacteroides sp. PF5-9]MDH6358250.1 TonB-linked SusC/RagA family outer membrane protein [Parabacteroides sp. PF5-9]
MELHTIRKKLSILFTQKSFAVRSLCFVFVLSGGTAMANTVINDEIIPVVGNEVLTVSQQAVTVTGTVTDELGDPMPGVNVVVKGTTNGTVTGMNGEYSLNVSNSNAILAFSFLGYTTTEMPVGNQRVINVQMGEDVARIDEVVVTALGIVKKEKSLTYSTQIVDGDELTRAKDPNMINSLAGKTAGVQINKSASGLGGSVKVVIRGNRSVSGSNQPLYVIDGVPINSSSNNQTATTLGGQNDAGNRDGGDGISNLNPDDIESMNILKGPAAAALYGSSAANGVVVITTKKGRTGRTEITFNSNTTWENAVHGIPEFQSSYGGTTTSWGKKPDTDEYIKINGSPDYTKDLFKTGFTTINSLALSAGSETMQTYFSYANTYGTGVIDNGKLSKHNFNFRETASFFDKRLTADANINLLYQNVENRPSPGGFYMNPLVGVYRFPRGGVYGGESFAYYKENYQYMDTGRNMYLQNWYTEPTTFEQNPFWLINKTPNEDERYRTIANLTLSYKINDHFTIQGRGNADFITDNYEMKMYAGTTPSLAGGTNGRYLVSESNSLSLYGDAMLTYQQSFKDFTVNATIGASIKDDKGKSLGLDSRPGGLYNPNLFTVGNMDLNGGSPSMNKYHAQEQAVFFAGQVGFRDWLFLDVTARNDWTSTLAFTKYKNKGFFYPSVGLTYVINESLELPEFINLGKIRGAWSKVGNGLPRYRSNPLNSVGSGGVISYNSTAPFSELKPEMTTSIEVGTEWRLFGSRLEFDFTYYKTNTKNQLFSLSAPSGSKYTTYYMNAGNIQNQGIEIVLGGSPVWVGDFRWKTGVNFSLNRNKVKELVKELPDYYFNIGGGGSNSYTMRLEEGGSFGDFYGRTFKRDEAGTIQYDDKGLPIPEMKDLMKLGNTSPDFNLGWQNTFTYKDFSLYFLIDGRFGGEVLSLTEAELDKYGVSKITGIDRDRGGVRFDGKVFENVDAFYNKVGGRDGITEHYVYSATNIRLRELSIGYSLPRSIINSIGFIKGANISLIGRNLFFFKNDAPYDPDGSLSVGNSLQGVDVFGMPSSRSFGFNLKVNF